MKSLKSDFTPHCLRHTYASLILQAGERPVYVQRQLGHASIKMTVDTYGRWLPMGNKAADRTGPIHYRREYVPASELSRVRVWVRRFRTDRARGRAVLVFLRRRVSAMEYRARRRTRI